jgi:phosphate-selective porin OprO and OprP
MSHKHFARFYLVLIALIVSIPVAARAQAVETAQKDGKQRDSAQDRKASEVEELKSKLDQLQQVIEQQNRVLAEMQKRIGEIESKTQTTLSTAASKVDRAARDNDQAAGLATAQTQSSQSSPAQTQTRPADRPVVVAGWDNRSAFLRSTDGNFETRITGYGQLDFRGYETGTNPTNTFLIRRARLSIEGRLHRYFDYKVEGDFADTNNMPLRDLFVRVRRIDEAQLTFGQFRVPISQEEIRSDAFQDFVERSMVNNLVPSRSPGVQLSGVIDKGVFEYQIGAFNGKGLLTANNNGTPETALRVRFNPWKHSDSFLAKGFIFGGAVTRGRSLIGTNVASTSVRGRTESQSVVFYAPDNINGEYVRANGEMTWLLGPAAIRAEYDQTNQHRDHLGPGGSNLPGVVGKGYTAQFTYLLTGEDKPEAGAVSPKRALFEGGSGVTGLGAWELKFRYANLQIANGTTKASRAETFYFGPNWYMNRFVRYLLDFGIERFKNPLQAPRPGDRNFFVVLSRIQFAF